MKRLMLAFAVGVGFFAAALASEDSAGSLFVVATQEADPPSEKPDDKPSEKPDGEGGGGTEGGGGGGASETIELTGVLVFDNVTTNLTGGTVESTTTNQNVVLAKNSASATLSNYTLIKSGDTSSEDASNFFAVNAVVAAKTNATIYIDNSTLQSNANGANCLFASGDGCKIYAYNCNITSTKDSSRGLDATYEGTVIAAKMKIVTAGNHCAALATDRGNGYISVENASLSTAGQGSPLLYSTGVIEANCVTGTATGAQIAGIEGLSTIRIKNSDLSGSAEKASESVPNGVMIYQSNSGDSTEGTATFEVSKSALKSTVSGGAMFYITNSKADIRVQDTEMTYDSADNYLVLAAGNDGSHGWGTAGANGAEVVFTAIDQPLAGNVFVDAISSFDLYLTNSTYTGTVVTTNSAPDVDVSVSADSTWIVTSDCTLKSLTAASGAKIVDAYTNTVSIVGTNGTLYVSGTSDPKVTVCEYTSGTVLITNAITDFEIDRTAFDKKYNSQSEETKTYYFKPHAPTNAVVWVEYNGTKLYPDMDHKYWVDAYWTNGITVTISYSTEADYFFADGSSSTNYVLTIAENRIDVYPPAGFETAYKAQAKSGATYYPTLKDAIEASSSRSKIYLIDNITLEETLTITNSITLNLDSYVITLGNALTNAFVFTSKYTTISNGTINSSFLSDVADSVMLRFTNCEATLTDLTIDGTGYETVIYCNAKGSVSIYGGSYNASTVLQGDDYSVFYKSDVEIAPPEGYAWKNGRLVAASPAELITPGVASDPYDDAQSATNAAVAINNDKVGTVDVPTGVEGDSKTTYLGKIEATVTSDNCVIVDLTSAAVIDEQTVVDAAVTNATAFASLISTNASLIVTISPTTPGLYYWILGGTDVTAITNVGAGVLSTDGGSVELTKPTLDATKDRAFFKVASGVLAPAVSDD